MKKGIILSGVIGSVLLVRVFACQAEKWEINDFVGNGIETSYYDADSIKVQGKTVSWTEKHIYTSDGIKRTIIKLSKYQACKRSIAKKGNATQVQTDLQIENGKYRGVAVRYYNKTNELICTHKDMGNELDTSWHTIKRGSPMESAYYDLVTKYKVNIN